MLSYYAIYCEKFRKVLQRTEKVALKNVRNVSKINKKQLKLKQTLSNPPKILMIIIDRSDHNNEK